MRRFVVWAAQRFSARAALLAALALAWPNFLLTSRWAHVPGSIHGWKRPWYAATLIVVTGLALRAREAPQKPHALFVTARVALLTFGGLLVAVFVCWFPPSEWGRIPFLDNWPPRYQATQEGIALLRRGAIVGWQWNFLGGYHSSSDLTQALSLLAFVPEWFFGARVGFHLLHALLFGAIPVLVYLDLKHETPAAPRDLAVALVCLLASNYSYYLVRSGDTNSLAGAVCTAAALVGTGAARRGSRWGGPLLLTGLVLICYTHIGFLLYAVLYLALDALWSRDWRSGARAALAVAVALVASLPMTWESLRFPDYFLANNVRYARDAPFDLLKAARGVYYNAEFFLLPGRWFNDHPGLAHVLLPVLAFVALRCRTRPQFHALAALATLGVMLLNIPQFAYTFLRPLHMLPIFVAPTLAWFLTFAAGSRQLVIALLVLLGLYMQIWTKRVPHIDSLDAFNPALLERIRAADGHLVLLENSPHRNMNASPDGTTERTPFNAHFESLLPAATGKRFYAGFWDGWQWSPYKGQVLAGGTLLGRSIDAIRPDEFSHELRRWGIRHLFVWSARSKAYLDRHSEFARVWQRGWWAHYEFATSDLRSVTVGGTVAGAEGLSGPPDGHLGSPDPLGADVTLTNVREGHRVVVRTNYHPAWEARLGTQPVPLYAASGQLAFDAPRAGSYVVRLEYPRRPGLSLLAILSFAAGLALLTGFPGAPAASRP